LPTSTLVSQITNVPQQANATVLPTLAPPVGPTQEVLIPVTGGEFTEAPFGIPFLGLVQGLLVNLGLAMVGFGFILHGFLSYTSKH
jgi:hypothetical protein